MGSAKLDHANRTLVDFLIFHSQQVANVPAEFDTTHDLDMDKKSSLDEHISEVL